MVLTPTKSSDILLLVYPKTNGRGSPLPFVIFEVYQRCRVWNRILKFIRGEFSNWQYWEIIFTLLCTSAITVISIVLDSGILGIASAIAGTLYTMLAGKGKISCYIFGIFNSAAYGYISFSQKLYGDAMLNWLWYLPMMFAGIILWRKKRDETNCIIKNRLSPGGRWFTFLVCAAGVAVYSRILALSGDPQPVVDAVTTVLSVSAMILTVKRCVEQWLMWIIVNAVSVIMWFRVWQDGGDAVATLLWWLIMLITGIIFFIQWYLAMKKSPADN